MRPRRQSLLSHGLSPYKKAKEQIFLREQAPDKICFLLFCMACGFRKFMLDKVGMGMIYCSSSLWRGVRVFKEPVLKTGDSERGRGFESHLLRLWYFTILYILILFSWRSTQVAEGAPLERE